MTSQHEYKTALQRFQSRRLRRDHADLAGERQYAQLAEFFFDEMYGPRDWSARDSQARRLHSFIHVAPGLAVRDVEQVLKLLDLTNRLDDDLAARLRASAAPLDFDESTYDEAFRAADNYGQRAQQLQLVRDALYNVYRLARKPLLNAALSRTYGMAQTVGMADIHRFLLAGYTAIKPVRDIHRFVEAVCVREELRLDRIYAPRG